VGPSSRKPSPFKHSAADIDKHLAVFEKFAPALAKAQNERGMAFVGAADH